MKSWQQRERALDILSKETGYVRKPHGGRLRVALAFPNTYWVGMSNLGFQTVYRLFNDQAGHRLRARVPAAEAGARRAAREQGAAASRSSRRRRSANSTSFAFSVSFEWDYVNVLTLLRLAGIPRYAAERTHARPARSSSAAP